jgi:2-keto-4-pentenoate hydratase
MINKISITQSTFVTLLIHCQVNKTVKTQTTIEVAPRIEEHMLRLLARTASESHYH